MSECGGGVIIVRVINNTVRVSNNTDVTLCVCYHVASGSLFFSADVSVHLRAFSHSLFSTFTRIVEVCLSGCVVVCFHLFEAKFR